VDDDGPRIDELRRYDVFDTGGDPGLDRLCELAARVCGVPMAVISFVDEHELRFLSQWGLPAPFGQAPMPLEETFCRCTIRADGLTIVRDARTDERFRDLAIVAGEPHIRFYAGAPVVSPLGHAIGTVCALDTKPGELDANQRAGLLNVRDAMMDLLAARRELAELRRSESLRQEAVEALLATQTDLERRIALRTREVQEAHDKLERNRARLIEAQRVAHVGSFEWTVADNRVGWSDELYRIYGVTLGERIDGYEGFLSRVHPSDLAHTRETIRGALESGSPFAYDHRIVRSDDSVRMLHTRGEAIVEDGKVVRLAGSCWDVTEQWQAKRALAHTVALLEATVAVTGDALLVLDADGKVAGFNDHFATLWKLPADISRQDESALELVVAQLADGEQFRARLHALAPDQDDADRLQLRDGRVIEVRSSPQRLDGDVAGRVCSFRHVAA
jgi:PAS domain-containing protein